MAKKWTYDEECYHLAKHFLRGEPSINVKAAYHRLAWVLQEAAEDEIQYMRDHGVPGEGSK